MSALTEMPDAAERLVDHALGLDWSGLPAITRTATHAFLFDSLAVGVAGCRAAHADDLLTIVQSWGSGGSSGVLGRPGVRLPAPSAAFLNAFHIHGQEFDCVHEPAVLHPMATVLSALLAESGRGEPVAGADFLAAIVSGVDVAVTLGIAAPGPLKFFRPATAGIFGCVAAIARMRRMERDEALDAFGHALAFVSGTMQAHVEGKPALPLQVANASRNSLNAIDLARAGIPGVRAPLEGPFGYFALMEGECALPAAIARLGTGHRIEEVSWKPYPTGRAGHGGIVAVQSLMRLQGLQAAMIDRLDYHAPPLIHRLVGRPAKPGMSPAYARLCLPYLAAITLTRGKPGLSDFDEATLNDPALLALAAKVKVIADGNPDAAAFVPARAVAQLNDGGTLTLEMPKLFGSPAWPLTLDQQQEKASECLAVVGLDSCLNALIALPALLDGAPDAASAIRATGVIG